MSELESIPPSFKGVSLDFLFNPQKCLDKIIPHYIKRVNRRTRFMWLPLQHVFQDKCLRRILDADRVSKQIWLTFLTAWLYDVLITNSFIGCHQNLGGKNCQIWQPKCPNNSAGG